KSEEPRRMRQQRYEDRRARVGYAGQRERLGPVASMRQLSHRTIYRDHACHPAHLGNLPAASDEDNRVLVAAHAPARNRIRIARYYDNPKERITQPASATQFSQRGAA